MNIMLDFGAVRENEAAFAVAVAAITSGDIAGGGSILAALRDHICSTGGRRASNGFCRRCWRRSKRLRPVPPLLQHKLGRSTRTPEGAPPQKHF